MNFTELRQNIEKERKALAEIERLFASGNERVTQSRVKELKHALRKLNDKNLEIVERTNVPHSLRSKRDELKLEKKKEDSKELEAYTLKRLKESSGKKKGKKEIRKRDNTYSRISNKMFGKLSKKLIDKGSFDSLERDLLKANLDFTLQGYVSTIFMTTFIFAIIGLFIFIFFWFFKLSAVFPIVRPVTEDLGMRFIKTFWIMILIPISTFLMMYVYPSLERKSAETSIDFELPFATINMAAISGSMLNPSKIFTIMIKTGEYPAIRKQLTKLINEINIYGYDLVSALRTTAFNSPSKKLSELFNGLATTINSGGDLVAFFDKRAETLLFDHRIQREKETKAAETFMDIYISIVIAAPMILMLLLMMMKISGLGLSLSTSAISLIMVLGVSMINVFFIVFLHLKKTGK